MNFGGSLENTSPGGGGGARFVADLPYNNNNNMSTGAIAQTRLVSPITKSMFNSPGLSLALVLVIFLSLFLANW